MRLPDFEALQVRALDRMQAAQAVSSDRPEVIQRLASDAQTHALLSIGAALHELAEAIRERQ